MVNYHKACCRSLHFVPMGQTLARRSRDRGTKLWEEQRFDEAIHAWETAMKRTVKATDRFEIFGSLCLALCDMGKYRNALTYAGQQIEIANKVNNPLMITQAYFHLALCNERVSEYSKSVTYCRYSLQVEDADDKLFGWIHFCLGNAYFGLSEFPKAWKSYSKSLTLARTRKDVLLEMLVQSRLGYLFSQLVDFETGLGYCRKAWDSVNSFAEGSPMVKYKRQIAVFLAVPNRKTGSYNEAMEFCEDAMKSAMMYGDRQVQARCLMVFADIHRKRSDFERAMPRYESAYSILSETGDRLGQAEALSGMAKTATCTRNFEQAIELNTKSLDIVQKIGNKLEMLRCHARLQALYKVSGETSLSHRHSTVVRQLLDEMELFCGVCDEIIGEKAEKLDALDCGHFIHNRCSVHLSRSTLGRSGKIRPCPACRRKSSMNPTL